MIAGAAVGRPCTRNHIEGSKNHVTFTIASPRADVRGIPHGHVSGRIGGLQDAYTYIRRGKVFANAQTGNIVLMSQSLFEGDFARFAHYFIPVLAFALGVAAAECIRLRWREAKRMHWRQLVLLTEIALLFVVGFFPAAWDIGANALVSFSCAMQVQAFRKVHGYPFASTMCIGNLRSGMDSLVGFGHTRDKKLLWKALHYFGVIFVLPHWVQASAHSASAFSARKRSGFPAHCCW